VVVQIKGAQLAKKMAFINSPYGALFSYMWASLPGPASYEGDDPLPLTLGRPVAIEVTVKGQYTNIVSFHRPEDFELGDAPEVARADLIFLEGPEALTGEADKALFLKLHRDIRSWFSKRIRT